MVVANIIYLYGCCKYYITVYPSSETGKYQKKDR